MLGNSRSHGRWMLAGDHFQFRGVLPACSECVARMHEADQEGGDPSFCMSYHCHNCTNWMALGENHPLLLYNPPQDFPKGFDLGGDLLTTGDDKGRLLPRKITYTSLKAAVQLTQEKVEKGDWTTKEGVAYIKANGITEALAKKIVSNADKWRDFMDAWVNRERDPEKYGCMYGQKQNSPGQFKRAKLPSVWNRMLPLRIFIDTPMHLLFLGIAKSVFELIGEWAVRSGRRGPFRKEAMDQLQDLEDLKLQWLTFHVKTFDTWGGWVSEKMQSLCRVALWIYGPLVIMDEAPAFLEPVDRTVDKWLLSHYQQWLKVRGLPDIGTKEELREKVMAYLDDPLEKQPKVLPPRFGAASGVMSVVRSMVLMMTTILQPAVEGEPHGIILALRVRMFLNAFQDMEMPLRAPDKIVKVEKKPTKGLKRTRTGEKVVVDGNKKEEQVGNKKKEKVYFNKIVPTPPMWLARFNFLSLLNLPESLTEFGSPRNYFEGKYLGERYVQEVKNVRKQCPPRNMTQTMLRKLHEGKALEAMLSSQSDNLRSYRMTKVTNEKKKLLTGNVRIYPGMAAAIKAFHSTKPVSLLQDVTGGFGILFYENGSNRGQIKFLKLERKDENVSIQHGMRFWLWVRSNTVTSFDDLEIKDFVVLLPKKGKGCDGEYTMVSKEWSPAMLEHYNYSKVGVDTKVKLEGLDSLMGIGYI
jgi:hypothetical protein